MIKQFKKFLNEAEMLDISIKDASKEFNTPSKISSFLKSNVTIFEKYDGVKVTLIRNDTDFSKNYFDNWIVAYKGNILYPEEYAGITSNKKVKKSIGTSQFKFIHDHLKKVHSKTKQIPKNTEFFIEFLMDKPTLTRNYKFKHGMILIASSPTKYSITNGMIKSTPTTFNTSTREKYAKMLGLNVPRVVYKGKLEGYIKGHFETVEEKLQAIKKKLLDIESEFGGKTEGVVIAIGNSYYKFLQDDQHDKNTRLAKKQQYKMSPSEENKYWKEVRAFVEPLVYQVKDQKLSDALKQLSKIVYDKPLALTHEKKNDIQIQDDVFLTGKQILIRKQKGNNGALFIGRFSPPTKAHIKIIEDALKKYDTVTVNIVKAAKTDLIKNPFDYDIQKEILLSVFPQLEIQQSRTGNLFRIMNKAKHNINVVLAGSDRVQQYKKMLEKNLDVTVKEIKRTEEDVSATKLRNALLKDDFIEFKKNADPRTYKYYEKLKSIIEKTRA